MITIVCQHGRDGVASVIRQFIDIDIVRMSFFMIYFAKRKE